MSKVTGKMSDKYGRKWLVTYGNLLHAIGFGLFGLQLVSSYSAAMLVFAMAQSL